LEGMIVDIPDASIDDIMRHYQWHTVGVSASISQFLRRVARAVVCYHEKHPWCYIFIWIHVLHIFDILVFGKRHFL
jgi:hypothetical protein